MEKDWRPGMEIYASPETVLVMLYDCTREMKRVVYDFILRKKKAEHEKS